MAKRKLDGREAADFLSGLYSSTDDGDGGYVELRARKGVDIVGRKFCATLDAVQSFANEHGVRAAKTDCYFGIAKRRERLNKGGGKKTNVLAVPALWADIDVKKHGWSFEDTARALYDLPGILQPSALVHSGGGFHAYWFLKEPHEDQKEVEGLIKAFQKQMGSDMVWDCSRVLRLPGTFNARAGKMCRTIWNFRWARHDIHAYEDAIANFDLYLGPNGFVPKDELPVHELHNLTPARALQLNWDEGKRGWNARFESLWATTRYHGQYPFIGIDEAQLRSTAYLWSFGGVQEDVVVEMVLRETRRCLGEYAPDEASQWDWEKEEQKIRDKLHRWIPRWELISREREAEKRRLAKEARDAKKQSDTGKKGAGASAIRP